MGASTGETYGFENREGEIAGTTCGAFHPGPVVDHSFGTRDRLTGAANRDVFERSLDAALSSLEDASNQLYILFLDLDRFKSVNDTLGHAVGDTLLCLVVGRLQTTLRSQDVLARFGGDEFAILVHGGLESLQVGELAKRLIDIVERPYLVSGHVVNIGTSIGISCAPGDGISKGQLLRCADLALYHSKASGRSVFHFFDPAMEQRAHQRRALEFALRKALTLKQLELHYQPQIDVERKTIIGLKGLLRWNHPDKGLLLPANFLPLAEELGLAVSIGTWVIKTACRDAAAWPESVLVSVDVSASQFESAQFIRSTEAAIHAAGISGNRLEFEVTEEILLRENSIVRSTLQALRVMGVTVAMQSFGTGMASLSQLVNFPLDKIKIDPSLVSSTDGDAKSRAILRAISALGQSLGIPTLVEGVETTEHLAHVRAESLHALKGFYCDSLIPGHKLNGFFPAVPDHSPSVDHSS